MGVVIRTVVEGRKHEVCTVREAVEGSMRIANARGVSHVIRRVVIHTRVHPQIRMHGVQDHLESVARSVKELRKGRLSVRTVMGTRYPIILCVQEQSHWKLKIVIHRSVHGGLNHLGSVVRAVEGERGLGELRVEEVMTLFGKQ